MEQINELEIARNMFENWIEKQMKIFEMSAVNEEFQKQIKVILKR